MIMIINNISHIINYNMITVNDNNHDCNLAYMLNRCVHINQTCYYVSYMLIRHISYMLTEHVIMYYTCMFSSFNYFVWDYRSLISDIKILYYKIFWS